MAHNATPSGQLRSVAPGWTFWAVESMIDEIAHSVGKDPAQYRIDMLDGRGANAGGAQDQCREGNEDDQAERGQGDAQRQREARDGALITA